jgi:hypothetical protein
LRPIDRQQNNILEKGCRTDEHVNDKNCNRRFIYDMPVEDWGHIFLSTSPATINSACVINQPWYKK